MRPHRQGHQKAGRDRNSQNPCEPLHTQRSPCLSPPQTHLHIPFTRFAHILGPNAPPSCFCSQAAIQKKIDKGDLPKDAPMKVPDNAVKENIVSIKPLDVLIEIFEGTAHGQMLNKMLSMGSATFDLKGITLAEVHSRSH